MAGLFETGPFFVTVPDMSDLAERKCKPCEGGVDPLSAGQAGELMAALHADWQISNAGKAICRSFEFPGFGKTIAFANAVAWIATVEGHHPKMTISYGSCHVLFTTTAIDGLSDNDFICAAKIDRMAAE